MRDSGKERRIVTVVMRPVATSLEANLASDQMNDAGKGTLHSRTVKQSKSLRCSPCACTTCGRTFFDASMTSANRGATLPALHLLAWPIAVTSSQPCRPSHIDAHDNITWERIY